MSYNDGNEYISPLLFSSFFFAGFDVVAESPNPFPDAADKGKWLLDVIADCERPSNCDENPFVATRERAANAPTNIAEFDGDIPNRFLSNKRIVVSFMIESRLNKSLFGCCLF